MPAKKKTKRKAKGKTAAKKGKAVDLLAEIRKIDADKPPTPKGLVILSKAADDLLDYQRTVTGADATATKNALIDLRNAKDRFTIDHDKPYKSKHARKMASLVTLFARMTSPADSEKARFAKLVRGWKNPRELEEAYQFQEKVEAVNSSTPPKKNWNAELILEAVEKIPELVHGVSKKAEAQKLFDAAVRKKKKFTRKASAYITSIWAAGADKDCDIVHKYGREYKARPKSQIQDAIRKSGSAQ